MFEEARREKRGHSEIDLTKGELNPELEGLEGPRCASQRDSDFMSHRPDVALCSAFINEQLHANKLSQPYILPASQIDIVRCVTETQCINTKWV